MNLKSRMTDTPVTGYVFHAFDFAENMILTYNHTSLILKLDLRSSSQRKENTKWAEYFPSRGLSAALVYLR